MLKIKVISLVATSLFVLSNANADSLAQDVYDLQIKTKRIVKAVKANRAAISINTDNVVANDSAINTANAAISVNAADIALNTTAIDSVAAQIAVISSPATYDYKKFTTTVSSKTFSMISPPGGGCGDTETRTFLRVANGDVTNLKINRTRTLTGNICHNKSFNYILTPDSKKLVSKENNDLAGNLWSTDILGKPFTVAKSSMVEGKSFGGATGIKNQTVGGSLVLISSFVNTVTVERVQDVTVPAGTFTGCIKVHTVRNSGGFGSFNRYSWFCPGIGEVKRTQIDPVSLGARFWKLTSYTP